MTERKYTRHGYRGHWEVRGPEGLVVGSIPTRFEAESLAHAFERAYLTGMRDGVEKAESIVQRKEWSQ